jgi:hypothetical protein
MTATAGLSVSVQAGASVSGSLSWDAVAGATGYLLSWDVVSGPPYGNEFDVGNVTSYPPDQLPGIGVGIRYVNVRSYDESGIEGPWGTEITVDVTTVAPQVVASALSAAVRAALSATASLSVLVNLPANLTVALSAAVQAARTASAALSAQVDTQAGGGTGDLAWDAVSGATGYRVYWDSVSGPPYSNSVNVGNVTSYTPTAAVMGTGTKYVNVRSYDASGIEGPWGTEITITL